MASAEGSIVVMPRAACAASASVTCGSAWPHIAPVSPSAKSTYSRPSTSVRCPPDAEAMKSGNEPGQRVIHAIGTPASRCSAASSARAAERGWVAANSERSSASSEASRHDRCRAVSTIECVNDGSRS